MSGPVKSMVRVRKGADTCASAAAATLVEHLSEWVKPLVPPVESI